MTQGSEVVDRVLHRDGVSSIPVIESAAVEEYASYFEKDELEKKLLSMENAILLGDGSSTEIVQGLFRDIHSLKGTASMLNIEPMANLLHNIEDVLGAVSAVCNRIVEVKRTEIFDYFLQCLDLVERLIDIYRNDPEFVLKDSRSDFGFYIRIIVESRNIVREIDSYFIVDELDESMF